MRQLVMATALAALSAQTLLSPVSAQVRPGGGKRGKVVAVPVVVSVKTNKAAYGPHQRIEMTMIARNKSAEPVTLTFMTGQHCDFEFQAAHTGKNASPPVWRWSARRMFTQIVTTISLAPGKALTYRETFVPGHEEAPVLVPGAYVLRATLTAGGRAPRPYGEARFTVHAM